jgi:hypothetical protein
LHVQSLPPALGQMLQGQAAIRKELQGAPLVGADIAGELPSPQLIEPAARPIAQGLAALGAEPNQRLRGRVQGGGIRRPCGGLRGMIGVRSGGHGVTIA